MNIQHELIVEVLLTSSKTAWSAALSLWVYVCVCSDLDLNLDWTFVDPPHCESRLMSLRRYVTMPPVVARGCPLFRTSTPYSAVYGQHLSSVGCVYVPSPPLVLGLCLFLQPFWTEQHVCPDPLIQTLACLRYLLFNVCLHFGATPFVSGTGHNGDNSGEQDTCERCWQRPWDFLIF